jgi:hypothetical protein
VDVLAPGAAGNVATGAMVDFLEARGWHTGIDRDAQALPSMPADSWMAVK